MQTRRVWMRDGRTLVAVSFLATEKNVRRIMDWKDL